MEAVMKIKLCITILIFIIITLADSALAWDIKHTLKGLVENSPLIITGRVKGISSRFETEKFRDVIYTYVTIEPESVLKGESVRPNLTVKILGGKVGNTGGWSENWIPFEVDEEVLLFLNPKDQKNNIWEIKSISGKLSVANINGIKHFNCSLLRADEVSQYDNNPYFEKKVIIERINDYLNENKGGK